MSADDQEPAEAPLQLAWRPRAHLDRESIAIYLALECGRPEAARRTLKRIDEAIDRARTFPESGLVVQVEGTDNEDYRRVLAGPYCVYYRHDQTTLTIYRILHQRQGIVEELSGSIHATVDLAADKDERIRERFHVQ